MKKKKIAKYPSPKKFVRQKLQRTALSRLLPLLTLTCLLFITFVGVFSQQAPALIPSRTTSLPSKQLSFQVTITPTPTTKRQQSLDLVAKTQAATEPQDYCVNIPVLFYHHVDPLADAQKAGHAQFSVDSTVFEQQMSYLKQQGYITVALDTLVDGIINKKPFPPKTIGLTFDDGYSDMLTYAYPTLKKYGFIGNFAIATGLIDTPGYLSWEQLAEIARDPSMRIYNHTSTHADLVNNPLQAEDEIVTAQNVIQNRLGLRSHIFFYPYGSFSQSIIATLRSKGYVAAFTTLPGTLQCESSLMSLHRTRIGNAPLSFYGL